MTEELTERQKEALRIIRAHIRDKGYPPTVRELARAMRISGPKGAKKFLDILERKGHIERVHQSSRAVRLISEGVPRGAGHDIPVVGRVAAGAPITAIENLEGYLSLGEIRDDGDGLFLLRITGESMIGAHIASGDMVLVRPQPVADSGDIVVALIDGEATVKRYKIGQGGVSLVPENPNMEPILINGTDFSILGKVIGVLRDIEGGLVTPE
jgi:repressor LexA